MRIEGQQKAGCIPRLLGRDTTQLQVDLAAQNSRESDDPRAEHQERARLWSGNEFKAVRTGADENRRYDSGCEVQRAEFVADVHERGTWGQAGRPDFVHRVGAGVSHDEVSGGGGCVSRIVGKPVDGLTIRAEQIDEAFRLAGLTGIVNEYDLLISFAGKRQIALRSPDQRIRIRYGVSTDRPGRQIGSGKLRVQNSRDLQRRTQAGGQLENDRITWGPPDWFR